MSTWTTPATFVTGGLTSAAMNTEVRDHANFLKGALDRLTASTTADTGDTMFMDLARAAASGASYRARVTADADPRWEVRADGQMTWGSGAVAGDTNLYRFSANILMTDDTFSTGTGNLAMNAAGYVDFVEVTAPGSGGANTARLYIDDNGAGKTRLNVVFSSGTVQVLATQP